MPAIILAAGASRRLGRAKQLVRADGETLLGRTIRVALESGAGPVFVVLGANAGLIAAEVDLSGVQGVTNAEWETGIASSIVTGLLAVQACCAEARAVMLLVCDQPRLGAEHLRALMQAAREDAEAIVASAYGGVAGIPAIFPGGQFGELMALRGDAGARFLLRRPSCPLITVEFAGGERDIDTLEDLADAGLSGAP